MRPAAKFPWDLALHGAGRTPLRMGADVAHGLAEVRRTGRPFFIDANISQLFYRLS